MKLYFIVVFFSPAKVLRNLHFAISLIRKIFLVFKLVFSEASNIWKHSSWTGFCTDMMVQKWQNKHKMLSIVHFQWFFSSKTLFRTIFCNRPKFGNFVQHLKNFHFFSKHSPAAWGWMMDHMEYRSSDENAQMTNNLNFLLFRSHLTWIFVRHFEYTIFFKQR